MATEPAPSQRRGHREAGRPWLRVEWVLLGIALALFAYVVAPVLLLVFAGIAFAVALDGLAELTAERSPLSRGWALLAISLLMIALIAVFVVAIAPQVAGQIGEMQDALDTFVDESIAWLGTVGVAPEEIIETNGEDLASTAGTVMGHVARWGMTTVGALASFAVLLAIAGFAAADPALYRRGAVRLLPKAQRPLADETLSAVGARPALVVPEPARLDAAAWGHGVAWALGDRYRSLAWARAC
jgi:predicted PurR-regulated permease PerM